MRRSILAVLTVVALLSPAGCVMHKTSKAGFCRELRRTPNLAEVFGALTSDNPSSLRTKARRTAQQFTRLQRSAPRDIRSDVSQVANLAGKVAQAVEDSPNDPQGITAKLRQEASDVVGPTRAALRLAEYSSTNCHYDLNQLPAATEAPVSPTTFPFATTTR
ncbi:MAG: hypothetical protein M3Z46_06435 [Actinomycetota bacterium]|nr:hypothetical protein [Actinomycetota bacterium]